MSINNDFILASTSPSRKIILKNAGLNFVSKKPECDEQNHKKKFIKKKLSVKKITLELSKIKAKSISIKSKNKLVVGSDTLINFRNEVIEKVSSLKDAEKKIKKLSGKKHKIITSVVVYFNNKLVWCHTQQTTIKLRRLGDLEIKKYLKSSGSTLLNSVGCYQIEKKGPIIIENIQGDFFNVMGFPLFPFLKFLKGFNINK